MLVKIRSSDEKICEDIRGETGHLALRISLIDSGDGADKSPGAAIQLTMNVGEGPVHQRWELDASGLAVGEDLTFDVVFLED